MIGYFFFTHFELEIYVKTVNSVEGINKTLLKKKIDRNF